MVRSRDLATLGLLFALAYFCCAEATLTPTIGVLSVPIDGDSECETFFDDSQDTPSVSCFDQVYSKWLESAGARVAVIPYNSDQKTLDLLFTSVNGILFTGGGLTLYANTTYYTTALYLFNKAVDANTKGDYFPVWGTCMGFQLLNILASGGNQTVLQRYAFDSEDLSMALSMTADIQSSRLFGPMAPSDVVDILQKENVTANFHHDGVTPDDFYGSKPLSSFFYVLSTNVDRKGKAFVSTVEGKNGLPFYGNQWHPERPQFEWTPNVGINHSTDAVRAMQYVANFFVAESRRNQHAFSDPDFQRLYNVWSYNPVVYGDVLYGEKSYVFDFDV